MYEFGTIVLVPFPFTDLSSAKVRPALIVSRDDRKGDDVSLCFITSKVDERNRTQLPLESTKATGLKVRSAVRFDKIATLGKGTILGELGNVERSLLHENRSTFLCAFGFD
jgi:mRNA interferase MazF